jgi:polycystin 1L2
LLIYQVGNKTTYTSVHCLCNHLTFFGSVVVKPNPIGKPTLKKFIQGYATFVAVSVIFIVYFIALVWARRKDKADLIKVTFRIPVLFSQRA